MLNAILLNAKNKNVFGGVATLEDDSEVRANETFFGDYVPGRYAWILTDIEKLESQLPQKVN